MRPGTICITTLASISGLYCRSSRYSGYVYPDAFQDDPEVLEWSYSYYLSDGDDLVTQSSCQGRNLIALEKARFSIQKKVGEVIFPGT